MTEGAEGRSIELLEYMGNIALAKVSTRRFPGLFVQGDTLAVLLHMLEQELPDGHATQEVRDWLDHYESAMAKHGLTLPYDRG